jgi:hypothetical protein
VRCGNDDYFDHPLKFVRKATLRIVEIDAVPDWDLIINSMIRILSAREAIPKVQIVETDARVQRDYHHGSLPLSPHRHWPAMISDNLRGNPRSWDFRPLSRPVQILDDLRDKDNPWRV